MRLTVTSIFACPVERVRAEVRTTQLMLTVIKPLIHFQPLDSVVLPLVWTAGEYRGRLR